MSELAAVAHVLRRTTFGPFPGQVEAAAGLGAAGVIEAVLGAAPLVPGEPVFDEDDAAGTDGAVGKWLGLMRDPSAGLHEKLVWFWHGHFTSSHDKADAWALMWRQHLVLRTHALGNFRELAHAMTVDAAMLQWLDGDGSTAAAPNENHGRELMELFTIGRGPYGQGDVRAAALALSGWTVTDDGRASFDAAGGNPRETVLLGRPVRTAHDVVDVLCDRPECARFIAAKLYLFLVGRPASDQRVGELAAVFAAARLEIRPLVEAIVRDPEFTTAVYERPRYPIEWTTAAFAVCEIKDVARAFDTLTALGQAPFYPPNVAGWPPGMRWLDPGAAVLRAELAVDAPALPAIANAPDPVTAVLTRAGIYEPTPETLTAAKDLAFALRRDPQAQAAALLGFVLTTPEFILA